jgi:deoxyribodipyrimidine photo-lyase
VLLTEEDLDPGSLLANLQPGADVAVVNASGRRSPLGVAGQVQDFARGAMDDALERAGLGCAVRVDLTETDRDLEGIVAWAAHHRFEQLVTPYTPVGPAAEAMSTLTEALAERRIRLVPIMREYDRRAWPHATRGFFPFRKKIPALVRSIVGPGSSAA